MEMTKNGCDIGKPFDTWTDERKDALTRALKEHYGGHIPIHLSEDSISDYLHSIYSNWPVSRIAAGILYQVYPNEPFAPDGFIQEDIISIREWTPTISLKDIIKEGDYSFFEKNNLLFNSNIECKVGLYKNGEKIYFIYPRVPYMDFSRMFYSVYSIAGEIQDEKSKKKYEDKRDGLVEVTSKDSIKGWIKVTLSGGRKDDVIIRAVHYLIDYFLAYTIAGTEKGKFTYKELDNIIKSLERSPLRYKFTLRKEFDRLSGKTDLSDKMVAPLRGIVSNASKDSLKIPCYKIHMSPLFELYSYSKKSEKYHNLRFQ